MLDDPELLDEFVEEARDHLARIETILSGTSGERPIFVESINAVFRGMHSIKGAAALLGLPNTRDVSHAAETVLAAVREGAYELDSAGIQALLRARDRLLEMVDDPANEGSVDARVELIELDRLLEQPGSGSAPANEPTAPKAPDATPARGDPSSAETVRVRLSVLDRLMTLVGELGLVRNRTRQNFEEKMARDRGMATAADRRLLQQLDLVTSEIQETVLRTRMQPIGKVFAKIPKVCRDLAGKLEKRIRPVSLGDDVKVDKTVLECLSDPLLHLIRNACDHGLESPAERTAAGKSPVGTLTVEARLDATHISILISDDGRGVDTLRVAKEAVAQGVVQPDEVARMSEEQLCRLIFAPGFSTAVALTDVSGRGVGMDVVRTSVEGIGGSVDVLSRRGKGTTFTLRIPLSLAVVLSLIVRNDGEMFAIPQVNLEEVLCLLRDEAGRRIESVNEQAIIRVGGHLLPLVHLSDALDHPGRMPLRVLQAPAEPFVSQAVVTIAIVRVAQMRFGIIVDAAVGSEEIVVKPNDPSLEQERCSVGSTILGDGRVALILDVNEICEHEMLMNRVFETESAEQTEVA